MMGTRFEFDQRLDAVVQAIVDLVHLRHSAAVLRIGDRI
jgi:hypothetical protein